MNMWQYKDKNGDILPWFTDTFLRELLTWDLAAKNVLEWGSGWSTVWWAKRPWINLLSVEHNPAWYEDTADEVSKQPNDANLSCRIEKDYYLGINEPVYHHSLWDIIIVDGKWRCECAVEALKIIKLGGIIILDNSDWPEHQPIHKLLAHCESHHYPQTGHPDWVTSYWKVTSRSNPAAGLSHEDAAKAQEKYRVEHPGSEVLL